jgi:RNA polymerase sigma factor (sigma-70 family)
MSNLAPVRPRMTDPEPSADERRRYQDALVSAMRCAERYLPHGQALEIAHDVARQMLSLPAHRATGTLIFIAVRSRVRNSQRAAERRAAIEGAYHDLWSAVTPAWAQPGAELELRELHDRITTVLAGMPKGMRDVFVLVREEELSYREAAHRLGVSVGTVHTQLSRANALLRECVALYRDHTPNADQLRKRNKP